MLAQAQRLAPLFVMAQADTEAAAPVATDWMASLQDPWIYGGLLLIAVVVSVVVGNFIAARSRMEDSGWRFAIVLGSILVSLLILGSKWPPRFGVDLKGGTVIVGQVDTQAIDDTANEDGSFRLEDLIRQLKSRIDPTGLSEIVIRSQGSDRIEAIIPDVDAVEAERIWKKMTTIGFLQFRMVAIDLAEGTRAKQLATNQASAEDLTTRRSRMVMEPGTNGEPDKIIARWYDLGRAAVTASESEAGVSPAYRTMPTQGSLVRDAASGRIVNPNLYGSAVNGEDLRQRAEAQGINQLQILLLEPLGERFRVDGEHIRSTRVGAQGFEPTVEFTMTSAGARNMQRFTDYYAPQGQSKHFMAVVLDGNVMTAPAINSPIYDRGMIEGSFTKAEVEDLVAILNAGRIPVALKKDYISLDSVQSNLGEEMKQRGIYAVVISLILVLVFMAVYYYQYSGAIACLALGLNILLVAAAVMAVGQAVTLTGLAGFVLTVGMSVDANVLIFERIREELNKGTALRMAIRNGFDRATSTIVDANVTTLITAVVLYVIGTEQLKSFAVILILGILASMFTAIFVARLIFDWLERRRLIKVLGMMQLLAPRKVNVIGLSRVMLPVSLVAIVVAILASAMRGGEIFDYDLRGGSYVRVVFNEPTSQDDVANNLKQETVRGPDGEEVQFVVSALVSEDYPDGTYYKVESTLAVPEGAEAEGEFRDLKQVVKERFGDRLRRLEVTASPVRVVDASSVGGSNAPAANADSTASIPPVATPLAEEQETEATEAPPSGDSTDGSEEATTGDAGTGDAGTEGQEEATTEGGVEGGGDADSQASSALASQPTVIYTSLPQDTATGGAEGAAPGAESAGPIGQSVLGEFDLTFLIPIAEETVLGQVAATAETLDLGIAEENIVVTSKSGENRDTEFKVQVRGPSTEAIQSVVDRMKETLSSEPFFPSASTFGSQVAGQAQLQALAALFASLVGIVLYVWFRFQHIWFGLSAVVALVHDVLVVLGCIAISYWIYAALGGALLIDNFKISLSVVAALLTVVGYSLNDTIVVFDRIREVRGRSQKFTADMIDTAVGQTLSRTILTSFTTFIVVFILFGWGGDSIHAFAFALVIGVVVGTYSSVFVASPILLWLMKYKFIEVEPVVVEDEKD
jgi:SecD/SecF fusion protein